MSTIYNEYLTGTDREIAIIVSEYEAQIAKLNVLLEAVDGTLHANMLAAEAKVFAESGTYDDLTMLYTEAQREANENKVSILQKIIDAISRFFAKIKAKISGKPVENPNATANVDNKDIEEMNFFEKSWANIQSGVNKVKTQGILAGAGDLYEGLKPWIGGLTVTAVAGVSVWKHEVIGKKIDDLLSKNEILQAVLRPITEFLNKFKTSNDNKKDEDLSFVERSLKAVESFSNWVNRKIEKLQALIHSNFTAAGKEEKKEKQRAENAKKTRSEIDDAAAEERRAEGIDEAEETTPDAEEPNKPGYLEGIKNAVNNTKERKRAAKKAKKVQKTAQKNIKQNNASIDDAAAEERRAEGLESVSAEMFDSSDLFTESDMSEEDYNELCELFADL